MFLKEDYSAHLCCFLIGLIKVLVWLVITGTQWLIMILIIINVDFFSCFIFMWKLWYIYIFGLFNEKKVQNNNKKNFFFVFFFKYSWSS